MAPIEHGTHVLARTADGKELPRRAVTEVIDGGDFPVVWITTEEEWAMAEAEGKRPEAWPWPAEGVRAVEVA